MTDINLKSIVGRIEPLEEKQKALLADKRAIYMEAKKAGFNTKALRKIIAERRMKDREEVLARIHEYRVALGMAVYDVGNGASLREAATKHGVAKSTIHDAVRREEKAKIGQPAQTPVAAEMPPVATASSSLEVPVEEDDSQTHAAATVAKEDDSRAHAAKHADDPGPIPWFLRRPRPSDQPDT